MAFDVQEMSSAFSIVHENLWGGVRIILVVSKRAVCMIAATVKTWELHVHIRLKIVCNHVEKILLLNHDDWWLMNYDEDWKKKQRKGWFKAMKEKSIFGQFSVFDVIVLIVQRSNHPVHIQLLLTSAISFFLNCFKFY